MKLGGAVNLALDRFQKSIKDILTVNVLLFLVLYFLSNTLWKNLDLGLFKEKIVDKDMDYVKHVFYQTPLVNFLIGMIIVVFVSILKPIFYCYLFDNFSKKKKFRRAVLIKKSTKRIIPSLYTFLVFLIMFVPLFILFIIPGIMFTIASLFAFVITSIRNKMGFAAVKQSWRLTKKHRLKIFFYMVIMNIVLVILKKFTIIFQYTLQNDFWANFLEIVTGFVISDVSTFFILSMMIILEKQKRLQQ